MHINFQSFIRIALLLMLSVLVAVVSLAYWQGKQAIDLQKTAITRYQVIISKLNDSERLLMQASHIFEIYRQQDPVTLEQIREALDQFMEIEIKFH